MKPALLFLALCAPAFAQPAAKPSDLEALLQHAILPAGLPERESRQFCDPKIQRMPKLGSLTDWKAFADRTRREVLDQIVFRGDLARQWRGAKTRVEWLDTMERGSGYHIQKLRYEALPGLWIPALLYRPDKPGPRMPVHLAVNGHDGNGKAAPYKQIRCINLAKRGVATLNVEWLGMGQLRTEGLVHARMNQLDLCGVSGLAPYYLSMSRGLDVLLALPNADATRVLVTGLSGGGWQTITISALDTRVTLSNPVAGYSSFVTRAEFGTDLGDSEQTPNDLATIADYAHFTAMLGGRAALLTFNAKDNCCFAADHALPPLLEAAEPVFRLYGQPERLRFHINTDPGTHNFELDNRQALYGMVGDTFFPGDDSFHSQEIPCENEVKTKAELDVPLPADNLDFHQLALDAAKELPRASAAPTREKLREIVRYTPRVAKAARTGEETRNGIRATFWQVRIGDDWTLPVTELTRGEAANTVVVIADGGRKSAANEIEELLASRHRVLALDPTFFGEAATGSRMYLHALLAAAVGERPLGMEASQVAAVSQWCAAQFDSVPALRCIGPRTGLVALVTKALEPGRIGELNSTDAMADLHEILINNWTVQDKPELFCFGLLEHFNLAQLNALAASAQ